MYTKEDARYRDIELTLASHSYRGRSIGSQMTCHQFPGYGVCFDIGQATLSSTVIENVFVTHGHDDHIGGLGSHHLRRNGWGLHPAKYYVQEEDVELTKTLVSAQARLNRSRTLADIDIRPIGEGSSVEVGGGLTLRAFRATHRIPCLGYSLWGKRRRLKPEYQGAPREVLIAARAEKKVIDEEIEFPEIAFPGDTNLNVLKHADVVRKARVLLLECTFVDNAVSPRETHRTGHVHLDGFINAFNDGAFENEVIALTHFSARYSPGYLKTAIERKLRKELGEKSERIRLLLP